MMRESEGFKKLSKIVNKYGYVLEEAVIINYGKITNIFIEIETTDSFQPKIYFDETYLNYQLNGFILQPNGGYTINRKDGLEEYIKYAENAYKLMMELQKFDIKKELITI